MKVFVTGASGFIGSRLVVDLLEAGHEVVALARSDASEEKLKAINARINVVRGGLDNIELLKKAATESDGVIHLGFIHDFNNYEKSCETDRTVVDAICQSLEGTNKPFINSIGTLGLAGELATEDDTREPQSTREKTEKATLAYKDKGVRAISIRLSPTVHGRGDRFLIPWIISSARKNKVAYYIGEGQNVWPAVHVIDTAKLYVLALEKGVAGKVYHAVAEPGVKTKDIATAIGEALNIPVKSLAQEEADKELGFVGYFFSVDNPASSEKTRKELDWEPKSHTLLEDIREFYGDDEHNADDKYAS